MLLPGSPANSSGLEQRLRLKLGIEEQDEEAFYLVEHILLRPLEDDRGQQVPLLAQARHKDPYSLQLSVVLPKLPAALPEIRTSKPSSSRPSGKRRRRISSRTCTGSCKEAMTTFVRAYTDWLDTGGITGRRHSATATMAPHTSMSAMPATG